MGGWVSPDLLGAPCPHVNPSEGEEGILRRCILEKPSLKYSEFGLGLW